MCNFKKCPRCQENAYEKLATHGYCFNCNYSPDVLGYKKSARSEDPIPQWALDAIKSPQLNIDLIQSNPKIEIKLSAPEKSGSAA